jgi:RNA polymerase sigma-70 factor (ECF subfamily)
MKKIPDIDDPNKNSDEELVKLTLVNQDVFLFIMKRYEDKLLRYILRISSIKKEDAEDLLQEVFIKVYENLNDFDQKLKFSSWIYRITHNMVIDNFRKMKVRPEIADFNEDINNRILENIKSDFDIFKEIDMKYLREGMENVFRKMDRRYKEVLVLRFFEDKSYEEISDILKKPTGTVSTLINRAKKQFKNEFIKVKA